MTALNVATSNPPRRNPTMLPATIGRTYSEREDARDAAGQADERGHDDGVARQLQIDQPAVAIDEAQRDRVDDRQRVGQRDQKEKGIDGKRTRRRDLHHGRAAEQQRADQRAVAISEASLRLRSVVNGEQTASSSEPWLRPVVESCRSRDPMSLKPGS